MNMNIQKLSDISPLKAYTLNETKLNDYVFNSKRIEINVDENYDIALVLGCKVYEIMMYRAIEAVTLYRKGIINKILLTGGVGFLSQNRDDSEANVMRKYMLQQGVKDEDIIVEDKSRDTYENMANSVDQIESQYGKNGRIVIVTSDFHSKRSKGMLEKMTSSDIYSYGVLDGKTDIDKWNHQNASIKNLLRTEAFLLSLYAKKGIINNQEIEHVIRKSK